MSDLDASSAALISAIFATSTANFSEFPYSEPSTDKTIKYIDGQLGDESHVEDPLLTTHRLIRFYLVSSGETLYSASKILIDSPTIPLVALPSIARTSAEHCSRAKFLADPDLTYEQRICRAYNILLQGSKEYLSENPEFTEIIDRWGLFYRGRQKQLTPRRADQVPKYSRLVGLYFDESMYSKWSRPVHGNGVWTATSTLLEQQNSNLRQIDSVRATARSALWLLCTIEQVANLWSIDLTEIRSYQGSELPEWHEFRHAVEVLVEQLDVLHEEARRTTNLVDNQTPYQMEGM
ncbi:hypothetical protein JVX90_04245 [Gordonia sp. PDNC005]|uniref:hypothetical protein n=1 Tax=Gordonia sp. PDNC005 TaxID=2811424 RepID=UPI0019642630|nr:hypothetical protein [Gordonia sp. PDNC005]QRY63450.1 hypothetical protein JVX90_04245 [Gordonia sp. PDNC005]